MEEIKDPFDFGDDIKAMIGKLVDKRVKDGSNLKHILRVNFVDFENLIEEQKKHKEYKNNLQNRKDKSDTAEEKSSVYDSLKDILILKKVIGSRDEVSNNKIAQYMSQIRAERALEKSENHSQAIKKGLEKSKQSSPDTSNEVAPVVATPNTENEPKVLTGISKERFPGYFTHKKDWLDKSWKPLEFNDWEVFWPHHSEFPKGFRPEVNSDGKAEWNDFWENIWRFIYKLADENNLSDYDKTGWIGMKKISTNIANLWKDLKAARETLVDVEKLNPKGVGGI